MVDPSVVNLANLNHHVYAHIWKTYQSFPDEGSTKISRTNYMTEFVSDSFTPDSGQVAIDIFRAVTGDWYWAGGD